MSEERDPREPGRPPATKIQVQVDEDVAQGIYVNMAMVTHNDNEFCLDLIFVQPHAPRGKVRARVITSPRHAKRLAIALNENVAGYEKAYGPIDLDPLPPVPVTVPN